MTLRWWSWFFLCGVWFMSSSALAETCRCHPTSIQVWPDGKSPVSPRTHVWVRFSAYNPTLPYEKYSDFADYPRFWSQRFSQQQMNVVLFDKARKQYVAGFKTDLSMGQWRMTVFYPKTPLQTKSAYEIHLLAPGNLRGVLGQFVTGSIEDSPPPAPGIAQARYIWERTVPGQCRPPKPFAVLDLKQTPALSPHFFGIWLPKADGTFDDKLMPHLVLQPEQNHLFLGQSLPCAENNFVFPPGQQLNMLIKVGNLSGQWGPSQQVKLAIQSTFAPWSWSPNARILFWIVLGLIILVLGIFRVWLFQRASTVVLSDFLVDYDAIKTDRTWLALKQLVQKDQSLRRKNMILLALQLVLGALGLYVLLQEHAYFSLSLASRAEIYLVVGIIGVVFFLHGVIHLYFTWTNRSKRQTIAALPTSKSFQQASDTLLARWKK